MNDTGPPLTLRDIAPHGNRRADIRYLTIIFADQRDVIYRARYIGDDGDLMLTNQATRSRRRVTSADMQRPLTVIIPVSKP